MFPNAGLVVTSQGGPLDLNPQLDQPKGLSGWSQVHIHGVTQEEAQG